MKPFKISWQYGDTVLLSLLDYFGPRYKRLHQANAKIIISAGLKLTDAQVDVPFLTKSFA